MASIESIIKDADEYHRLSGLATRENVRVLLQKEEQRLRKLIAESEVKPSPIVIKKKDNKVHVKISNYGWDQSDKFVKLYITLNGVHTLAPEQVISSFSVKSVELQITGLESKDYSFVIKSLLNQVNPSESYHKVKTDMICLFLKKDSPLNWSHLTETEKKVTEKKTPKVDKDDDPGTGIMNFMKQMYEEGDDEMRRTIAKAWCEARDRQPDF